MRSPFRPLVALLAFFGLVSTRPGDAQLRVLPISDEAGEVSLRLVLRRLDTIGIFMLATAHPDDENSALLAMLRHGQGMQTTLVSATRGDGGQNEIGPELFDALGVLRTEELMAVHRFDGAEQYFTRAVDFGFSFSIEETFERWGKDEILGDYVRMIRTVRPDVVATMSPSGTGGGQHHQASARMATEAFRAAGDASRFPEQIEAGLRPWQAKKLYQAMSFGFRGEPAPPPGVTLVAINAETYDPLLGRTYAEIASEARSMHKCQGMAQLLALPGAFTSRYTLADTTMAGQMDKDEPSMFDAIDTTLGALLKFVRGAPPSALADSIAAIGRDVESAKARLDADGPEAAIAPLEHGLATVRTLRRQLASLGLQEDDDRFEIDYRLGIKERDFERALVLAHGVRLEALADDGVVVAGQPIKVSVIAGNRSRRPVTLTRVAFNGFDGEAAGCAGEVKGNGSLRCEPTLTIPADARLTTPYWKRLPDAARYEFEPDAPFGSPFRPTPFRVRVDVTLGSVSVPVDLPVQHRYEGNIFSGEKRMELHVVPRFAVRMSPDIAIVPAALAEKTARTQGAGRSRELRVTVTNGSKGAAESHAMLRLPVGWQAAPSRAPLKFTREDEQQTVRFTVTPPAGAVPGEYRIVGLVVAEGREFQDGYQVIEYPHIHRRHLIQPAESVLQVIDVKMPPKVSVGYVMGVGDQVPPAIEQLGARLSFIGDDELAWGDLSKYDVIVTGVRAYERRADLRAQNNRLLQYVERGGTLIVQYNKFEFNEAQYGPYPAKVSSNRITDENAHVQILEPTHPLFNTPNRVARKTWEGWVQERGLYFLGEKDPRYVDLVQMEDGFEFNKGAKRGALVEGRFGKGRWIYVGLGLWRQLPAGTDGAYQLLANLLALGRAPVASTAASKLPR
ncbi:MAG: PIG-L family deacetylase [Acidobacteria bacterium]|nr:PIG-L family deacetylase [Acidobacteriota bacterium]